MELGLPNMNPFTFMTAEMLIPLLTGIQGDEALQPTETEKEVTQAVRTTILVAQQMWPILKSVATYMAPFFTAFIIPTLMLLVTSSLPFILGSTAVSLLTSLGSLSYRVDNVDDYHSPDEDSFEPFADANIHGTVLRGPITYKKENATAESCKFQLMCNLGHQLLLRYPQVLEYAKILGDLAPESKYVAAFANGVLEKKTCKNLYPDCIMEPKPR